MAKNKKLSFDFTPEDMRLLGVLKKAMSIEQGKVSNVAAIRAAIRSAAKDKAA